MQCFLNTNNDHNECYDESEKKTWQTCWTKHHTIFRTSWAGRTDVSQVNRETTLGNENSKAHNWFLWRGNGGNNMVYNMTDHGKTSLVQYNSLVPKIIDNQILPFMVQV